MTIIDWIVHFGTTHDYLVYAVIVVLACAEGPILSVIFGIILRLGYFYFVPIYAALMLGDLLGDAVWYFIGRRYGYRFIGRFGKYFNITESSVEKVRRIFLKYKDSILIFSKMTNGLGFALVTLMTAGMVRVPFWRYMTINLAGQFVWSGILLGTGYFFGHLYVTINSIIGRVSIIALFLVIVLALNGYRKYISKRVDTMNI